MAATARQQGCNLLAFLADAMQASFTSQPPPALV
jgi:hypothetical protein